ncbi:MAG: hypothetical protein WCP89_00350 [archaeon]
MRGEIFIVAACLVLVFSVSFLFFNSWQGNLNVGINTPELNYSISPEPSRPTFTGHAVLTDTSGVGSYYNFTQNATKEDAIEAIKSSEAIISWMSRNNFSSIFLNDTLNDMKRVFLQAQYAEVMRNSSIASSDSRKIEAVRALSLVSWRDISYNNVFDYANTIYSTKENAVLISDKIVVAGSRIDGRASNSTLEIFASTVSAFKDERYNESERLLNDFSVSLENDLSQAYSFSQFGTNAQGFLKRNLAFVILFVVLLSFFIYFFYRKMTLGSLRRKIKKMKVEREVLGGLIKKIQEDRFRDNKISGLVYNIRLAKYNEKVNEINDQLPVLEERLSKILRGSRGHKEKKENKKGGYS